ncbi:MAG TPA: hypothetical protein VEC19_06240 [Usitatibacter sp.]|nr:hypothetical protein [Usitatibacter sp.]
MRLCRPHRVLAALCAAFALAYSQLVFAGFACAVPGAGEMQVAALCEMHCDYEDPSVDLAKPAPQLPAALVATMRALVVEVIVVPARALRIPRPAPGPAPPLIGIIVLRI